MVTKSEIIAVITEALGSQLKRIFATPPQYPYYDGPHWPNYDTEESDWWLDLAQAHTHTDVTIVINGERLDTHIKVFPNGFSFSVPFGHPDAGITGETNKIEHWSSKLFSEELEDSAWTYVHVDKKFWKKHMAPIRATHVRLYSHRCGVDALLPARAIEHIFRNEWDSTQIVSVDGVNVRVCRVEFHNVRGCKPRTIKFSISEFNAESWEDRLYRSFSIEQLREM